jgi:pimeloyl-ACP methyl ester carboxylesterase
MPTYANLGSVRTWYDERGTGEPLVLLHPGGADARAFGPNLDALATRFHVFTPDRRGHGHTPDVDGPLTYELMAEDTIAFLDTVVGGPAHLFGCSDGAIVALLVALRRPDLIRRLVFVAGVFHRDGWAPGVIDPNNVAPDFMARSYGEVSPDGIDHFRVVAAKLAHTHAQSPTLSTDDLADLSIRTLVMVADDDEVILEHAIAMYRSIRDAELAVIPGTSHGLLVEKPSLCNSIIVDFLANEPTQTLAPIRRTPPPIPAS